MLAVTTPVSGSQHTIQQLVMSGKDIITWYVLYSHNLRMYVNGKRQKGIGGRTTIYVYDLIL